MTPEEAKQTLDITMCICGREKYDHDFGFGGNEETGCTYFIPAVPENFLELKKIFHEGSNIFSPSSFCLAMPNAPVQPPAQEGPER